ncbi:MAG TPA: HAMP domain-containing sensor histidine kinase, partial [Thermoanaerobaculia bacterium]|nr:HAMP domain-containing sensor histidine kinase [Thermoanaerobaculia bacterium]
GQGMTAGERGRLFTPFAHSFPGGTGLGLAIVYRIVEEHGGTIRVDTSPGHGTTVSISLPLVGPLPRTPDSAVSGLTPTEVS